MFDFASEATMARVHGRWALNDGRLIGITGARGIAMIANMAGEQLVIETRIKMSDARSAEQTMKMLTSNQARRRALQTNNTGGFVLDAVTTALTKEAIDNTSYDIDGDEIRSSVTHTALTLIVAAADTAPGGRSPASDWLWGVDSNLSTNTTRIYTLGSRGILHLECLPTLFDALVPQPIGFHVVPFRFP